MTHSTAAIWLTRPLVRATAIAWLVYGVPHLVYHVRHRSPFDTDDQVSIVASLALAPILAIAILVLSRDERADSPVTVRD